MRPEIGFKGFTDDWEQRKLGDISSLITKGTTPKDKSGTGEVNFIKVENINDFSGDIVGMSKISLEEHQGYLKRSQLKEGDILFSIAGTLGRVTSVNKAILPANTNQALSIIRLKEGNLEYVKTCLKGNVVTDFIRRNPTIGAQPNLSLEQVSNLEIEIPSEAEQEKIGEYFSNLDHLITLHQRKYERLVNVKRSMLVKMFPQNGSKVPEIRFKGFTDDWEQRKFGEITELKSASRVHKEEWTSNGVPFYRSSDVMAAINGTENEKAFISVELYEKLSKVSGKLEEGDILVTGGGSVGNPYIVPDNKPLYTKDADLLWIKNKGKFHPYFLYEFFFSPTFRNYLGSISHVGTIAHYTITQLSDTPICLPSFEEQKEVGEYFQSLDNLITLHQRKIKKLQDAKKAFLTKMFA